MVANQKMKMLQGGSKGNEMTRSRKKKEGRWGNGWGFIAVNQLPIIYGCWVATIKMKAIEGIFAAKI